MLFDFYEIGSGGCPLYDIPTESSESGSYKQAIKTFKKKYPKLKKVDVIWFKDGIPLAKEIKLVLNELEQW